MPLTLVLSVLGVMLLGNIGQVCSNYQVEHYLAFSVRDKYNKKWKDLAKLYSDVRINTHVRR